MISRSPVDLENSSSAGKCYLSRGKVQPEGFALAFGITGFIQMAYPCRAWTVRLPEETSQKGYKKRGN